MLRRLLARMLPVAFGAGLYQINLVVNKSIATLAGVGAVSWINYADRVNLLPVGIFGTAIGVALLPLLTRQIQAGNEEAAIANQNRAIEVSLLLTVPAARASRCWPNRLRPRSLNTAGSRRPTASPSRTPCSRSPSVCRPMC